jgi:2,4-diaminopentanoate dehydrogenase
MSPFRVAHYGTGHTGTLVLRQLLERPDIELVGHLVHTPSKVGMDSGEIVGIDPVGVRAIGSFDEFCALDVDCVTYMATEFGREVDDVIDEMCRLLESGKNVVTTTFIRLVYPKSLPPELLGKLENACAAGQSAFMGTGIAPGFTTDALPVHLGSLSEAPRTVSVAERVLQGTYSDPLSFAALGFGTAPAGPTTDLPADVWTVHFEGALQMLANGYGWDLESIAAYQDVALADEDYEFVAGVIPKGTVAAVRLRFDGIVDGEPRLRMSWVYTMPDDAGDSWSPLRPVGSNGRRFTHIDIDGTPNVSVTLELDGGELPGGDATATRALNAIKAVCNATPTVHSALDLVVTPQGVQTMKRGDQS